MMIYETRVKPVKRYSDNSLAVKLPFGKIGHAFPGFETWELFECDSNGHLEFMRAANAEECKVLDIAIGRK